MEQKQLDELDEAYFGEEYVEDNSDEVKLEEIRSHRKGFKRPKAVKEKPAAEQTSSTEEKPPTKETFTVKKLDKPLPLEIESPVNPWSEPKKEEAGFFSDVSTWQIISVLLLLVVVLAVITEGFGLNLGNDRSNITLTQAQEKVLTYVNTQLLDPPFVAQVVSSKESADLYQVTLSVAGQNVETYVTKDGSLFFPEALPLNGSIEPALVGQVTAQNTNGSQLPVPNQPESGQVTQPEEKPQPPQAATGAVELTLDAKRWLFSPRQLTVKKGEEVRLTIRPNDLDFTFEIPRLEVKRAVSGITTITFTPQKPGTYEFLCSSCESYRGMSGTLVVE